MSNNYLKTDYSIVSRGTEKYNNHGYISISESIQGYRYLQNIDHNVLKSKIDEFSVKFKDTYMIENIALSRFQLIFEILYLRVKNFIKNNILIIGFGNLGTGTLISLLDKGFTTISTLVKEKKPYMIEAINIIKNNYNVNILIYTYDDINIVNYNLFIECSGSGQAIETIINECSVLSSLIILSTPRDNNYGINPLIINRKNLSIFGGHEFNGIEKQARERLFENILEKNHEKQFIKQFITIYPFSTEKLNEIKHNKNNLIELFKY